MKKKGLKYDQEKLRYDLIPPLFIESMAEVLTYGAKNIQKIAALFRHLQAWRKREQFDQTCAYKYCFYII
jgi:hypothetical protein